LDSLRTRIGEDERARIRAEERLKEIEENWESKEGAYKTELTQVQQNLKDLDALNNSLQDQLVSLTTQMSSLRQAEGAAAAVAGALNRSSSDLSLDNSFSSSFMEQQDASDQEKKTTDQWMQV
jgi:phage shock protein A